MTSETSDATRLVLLPVHPGLIHAYWEIGKEQRGHSPDGRLLLRFSEREGHRVEVGVAGGTREWYLFTGRSGGCWTAEVGILFPDGRFVRLAVSNAVALPNGRPAAARPSDAGSGLETKPKAATRAFPEEKAQRPLEKPKGGFYARQETDVHLSDPHDVV